MAELIPVDHDPFAAEQFVPPFLADWAKQAAGKDVNTLKGIGQAAVDLSTLPQRAIQNSQFSLGTGTYDPAVPVEAAMTTMGGGAAGTGDASVAKGVKTLVNAIRGKTEGVAADAAETVPAAAAGKAPVDVTGGVAGPSGGDAGVREAQLQAERRAAGRAPLPGLPQGKQIVGGQPFIPGPVARAQEVAERYMADKDFGMPAPEKYHELDKEHSKAIAKAFDEMKHAPDDPAVKASYEALIRETLAQYQAIKNSGLEITPVGAADYPYHGNPREVAKDVADNNHMAFFKTDEGFGSGEKADPNNPMLRSSGEKIGDHDMLNNDLFRVVHDYFGHIKNGYGFRATGEDNAWRSHAAMYSPEARPAMTSETRGQNSWVNYGPHGEANRKASGADTIYSDQKVGLMPEWTMQDRVPGMLGTKPPETGVTLGSGPTRRSNLPGSAVISAYKGGTSAKPISEMTDQELAAWRAQNAAEDAERARTFADRRDAANTPDERRAQALRDQQNAADDAAMNVEDKNTTLGSGSTNKKAAAAIEAAPAIGGRGLTDEHGLAVKGKDFSKASRAVLDEIASGPKGAGPLDLSSMNQIPDVPQVAMDRYDPKHGISPRMQDALQNPDVPSGISKSIEAGRAIGADKWYHNEPIRRAFVEQLGPQEGQKAFATYMDMVSATSPRSQVPENIRNASYYYAHAINGAPLPEQLAYPYGHVAQNLHRQNFETLTGPRPGELSAGAPEATSAWDIFKNPKPASFSQNLQGNLVPGTMDTHAFRNIAMRTGDPRFLETSISDKLKPGQTLSPDTLAGKYGEVTGNKLVYRPQKLLESGKLTLDEAKDIPTFWATKPNKNEYAAAEQLYRSLGEKAGLPTADAQAAAWSGAGEMTGLGTVPTHTFPELFNERVLYTAKMRNENPQDTLRDFIRGKKPLLSVAGVTAAMAGEPNDKMTDILKKYGIAGPPAATGALQAQPSPADMVSAIRGQ